MRSPLRVYRGLTRATLKIGGKAYMLTPDELSALTYPPGPTDEWLALVESRAPEIDYGPLYAGGFREF